MKLLDRVSTLWRRTQDALADGASDASEDTSSWPEVEARIYSIQARAHGRQPGVELWYEFHVDGDHWSGSGWVRCDDDTSAEALADAHPVDSKICIIYCPGNPSRSLLVD